VRLVVSKWVLGRTRGSVISHRLHRTRDSRAVSKVSSMENWADTGAYALVLAVFSHVAEVSE